MQNLQRESTASLSSFVLHKRTQVDVSGTLLGHVTALKGVCSNQVLLPRPLTSRKRRKMYSPGEFSPPTMHIGLIHRVSQTTAMPSFKHVTAT
jgi:hypothetical protein